MSPTRRSFLKTAGGFAIASVVPFVPAQAFSQGRPASDSRRQRVAVFSEGGFPEGEIKLLSNDAIRKALTNYDVSFLSVDDLPRHLNLNEFDLFINPYGSNFPVSAWDAVYGFLKDGGNWINIGGVPFSVPVDQEGKSWRAQTPQTQYHKKLGITQGFPVAAAGIAANGASSMKDFSAAEVYELYVRFTSTKDFPGEDGSSGARDARIEGIVYGADDQSRKIISPFVQIDRFQGAFAGGRWILANFKGTIAPAALSAAADSALQGAMELSVRSTFACYLEGEHPTITITARRPKGNIEESLQGDAECEIANDRGKIIFRRSVRLKGKGTVATGVIDAGKGMSDALAPGYYIVNVKLGYKNPSVATTGVMKQSTGFWMHDEGLLKKGTPLTLDSSYFVKGGKPYPVTGTTYMGSDVHRKFLFEPNPFRWHEDFREMKQAGINMVRTGIWTGWRNVMFDTGAPAESALRAMDAFVHTARAFDIPVIFTFFAFLPETWGGVNAYLDPRAVNAQKEFILSFVQRYGSVNDLLWDFINEPSFCNPKYLWQCRPNYDSFETSAWKSWLMNRYAASSDAERVARLQEMYRTTAENVYELPALEEFGDVAIYNENRPLKVVDYRIFAQETFTAWVKEMAGVIRSNGNPKQLITVGQDEGGTGESPGNHFIAEAVDFTSLHNWWLNDDLVWDSVVTTVPGKPNLVEETGVMFYEKMDGRPWRTEEEARNLLERKMAISFGAGGAGFVEWVWNTNPYMMSDNEAAIGLNRADGTAKPERLALERYAKFLATHREHFTGRQTNEVMMVIPHSVQFSTRNFATDATKRCVRVISHFHSMPISSVSEYKLDSLKGAPKLIIAPSLRAFRESAWKSLLGFVEAGSTLLISGIFDADEHYLPTERAKDLALKLSTRPVAQEEFLSMNGKEYRLSYRGDKIQRLELALIDGKSPGGDGVHQLQVIPRGKGTIIWSPLPVELSDPPQANIDLYDFAVRTAGIKLPFTVDKVNPAILVLPLIFASTVLLAIVSETDRDYDVGVTATESGAKIVVKLPAQRTAMLLFRRSDGKILGQL